MGGVLGTLAGAALAIPTGGLSMAAIPGIMAGAQAGGAFGSLLDGSGTGSPTTGSYTSSQGMNIPAYLQPMLEQGATEAKRLYDAGAPAYYSGEKTAPLDPTQIEGLNKTLELARAGSPLVKSAQDFTQNILTTPSGQNPYLDAILGKVEADANALVMSNFNKAGRIGSGANAGTAGTAVSNAALPYLFNQYNQDNANKFQAANMAPNLANVDYQDAARIATVGDAYQRQTQNANNDAYAKWQYESTAPGNALDQYLNRIYQAPGTKLTTTTQTGTPPNGGTAATIGTLLSGLSAFAPGGAAGMGSSSGFGITSGVAPLSSFGQINWS